jgi:hypothetical protein
MRPSATPTQELHALLRETPIRMSAVAALLDGLAQAERVAAVRSLDRPAQRRLYQAAEGFAPLTLADFVSPALPDLAPVRHFGRNTLPAFTLFEKRFARPRGADRTKPAELYGYNFQPTPVLGSLTGPGYYRAVEDPAHAEVLVDYNQVPPADASEVPAGWPRVRRNEVGLSRFVYGFMIDRMRRVSEHVSIGSASRKGREMGSWFVLCRDEAP